MLRPTFIMARLRLSDGLYDLLYSCLGDGAWQEGPSVTVAFSPTGILQLVAALVSGVPLRLRSCYLSSQPRELSD